MSTVYGTQIVSNNLILDVDAANIKSFGPFNAQVYAWGGGGAGGTPGGWNYGAAGGAGGAASGTLQLVYGTSYPVIVGGGGVINSTVGAAGGGGGASVNGVDNRYGSGGGGYSGIFSTTSTQATALLIAGGGGGGGSSRAGTGNVGGAGGGAVAQAGVSAYDAKTAYAGLAGTQSAAGADATSDSANTTGGQGALQGGSPRTNCYGGAGGGGYWGGSAGGYSEANTMAGGGGGSGYYNPTYVTASNLSTGSLTTPGASTNSLIGTAGAAGGPSTNGNSGLVVIQYPGNQKATGGTITSSGGYTIHTFTSSGIFTPGTNWSDISGNNNFGTLVSSPSYSSANGGSLGFSGSNYVTFNPTTTSTVQLTVSMFVNVASNPGTYKGFTGGNDGVGNDYILGFNIDMSAAATSGSLNNISLEGSGITSANFLTTPIAFGQWFHLAAVHSSTSSTLYINGVQNGSTTRTSAAAIAMKFLTIGARPVTGVSSAASYAFNGSIAQATYYTRALTQAEIVQNFTAHRGRFGL